MNLIPVVSPKNVNKPLDKIVDSIVSNTSEKSVNAEPVVAKKTYNFGGCQNQK